MAKRISAAQRKRLRTIRKHRRVHQKAREVREKKATTAALAKREEVLRIPLPSKRSWDLTREEVVLIKNQIAPGSTDEEFQFCLARARHHQLDPLKQQIYFVPKYNRSAEGADGERGGKVWVPIVGINGLRHIAARDHRKEFGTEDEPEFGPMIKVSYKWNGRGEEHEIEVPEWARVAVWKKGVDRPTVSTVWWNEIYPNIDYSPTVRNMPRLMLGKCAAAQANRKAYPETGGLYTAEEFAAHRPDYTPEGRRIIYESDERDQVQDAPEIAILKERGAWFEEHNCIRNAKHAAECPSSARALDEMTKAAEAKRTIDVQPTPEAVQETKRPVAGSSQETPKPPQPTGGTVILDWSMSETFPVVRGDIAEIVHLLREQCGATWENDSWYHIQPRRAESLHQLCRHRGYRLQEVMPKNEPPNEPPKTEPHKKSSRPAPAVVDRKGEPARGGSDRQRSGKPSDAAETPSEVSGFIDRVNITTVQCRTKSGAKQGKVMAYVTLLIDGKKHDYSSWDKDINEILGARPGQFCRVLTEKRGDYINIVALRKVGSQEYEDVKTPVTSVDREAGGRTLFGNK